MASKRVFEKKVVVSPGVAQTSSVRKPAASRRTTRSAPVEAGATAAAGSETGAPLAAAPLAVAPFLAGPTQETVAALAYSYWVARDCQGGSPEEDWLRAEQELRGACAASTAA